MLLPLRCFMQVRNDSFPSPNNAFHQLLPDSFAAVKKWRRLCCSLGAVCFDILVQMLSHNMRCLNTSTSCHINRTDHQEICCPDRAFHGANHPKKLFPQLLWLWGRSHWEVTSRFPHFFICVAKPNLPALKEILDLNAFNKMFSISHYLW